MFGAPDNAGDFGGTNIESGNQTITRSARFYAVRFTITPYTKCVPHPTPLGFKRGVRAVLAANHRCVA